MAEQDIFVHQHLPDSPRDDYLSKDMMKLVFISIVLSAPIVYYAIDKWWQKFVYHVKAVVANPVDSLRSDEILTLRYKAGWRQSIISGTSKY